MTKELEVLMVSTEASDTDVIFIADSGRDIVQVRMPYADALKIADAINKGADISVPGR